MDGDISVIFKKGDRDDPTNYRPITLLNSDYKIFTCALARRMKQTIHQIVSPTQKGFVPRELIQDCTLLMHIVESYINDEPLERQGLFLFFDMEKAFDRVSYKYLNQALKATGYGPNFRKLVGLLYNENNTPKRRVYTNGYYSKPFPIQSGVAQGCPLSPLLFTLVAEALKRTIEANPNVKGIKIGDERHLISQFADDTALLLSGLKSYRPALEAVAKWGRATSMRENMKKREGVALGKLRNSGRLPTDTKWVKDGEWARYLGNPVGNEVDHTAFFKHKLEAVHQKSKNWLRLLRTTYPGRNLIVQSMYFGSVRYWLYTLQMTKEIKQKMQKEADILWWSKEPVLVNRQTTTRLRRFVNKKTAIGPRKLGGMNNMDWAIHAESFTGELVIRYLHPTDQAWKRILDHILFTDKNGEIEPDSRMMLFSNIPNGYKYKILNRIPKKNKYIKQCLLDFWKTGLKPARPPKDRIMGSESMWYNHSFQIIVDWHVKRFFQRVCNVHLVSDIMNLETNQVFTRGEWYALIENYITKHQQGIAPPPLTVISRVDEILAIIAQIPAEIQQLLRITENYKPSEGEYIAISDEQEMPVYGIYRSKPRPRIDVLWIDSVGYPHETNENIFIHTKMIHKLTRWRPKELYRMTEKGRIVGPQSVSFPANTEWKVGNEIYWLDDLSIKNRTKALQEVKMTPPGAMNKWRDRLTYNNIPEKKVWAMRFKYASPRDRITWTKLLHRNLYISWRGEQCICCGQQISDNHLTHLARCRVIIDEFWTGIKDLTNRLGIEYPATDISKILGVLGPKKVVSREGADILALSWRCLYAALTQASIESTVPKLEEARGRVLLMLHSRVNAYGLKWLLWFKKQKDQRNPRLVNKKYRKFKCYKCSDKGEYEINPEIVKILKEDNFLR